jgi:DNA-binding transcriptional ArsR family regulator
MLQLNLIPLEKLERAAECMKVMSHPIRLRIVDILMQGEFPVHEIAEFCDLPPHQTCEHLRLLKGHGFLASQRKGRTVYYRIITPQLPGLLECVRKNCPEK